MHQHTIQVDIASSKNCRGVNDLKPWLEDPKFHELPDIAVGAKVMCTQNGPPGSGLVNGLSGTVVALLNQKGGVVRDGRKFGAISVHFDGQAAPILVKRVRSKIRYHEGGSYRKSTFPLILAYAMTGHRSQGATIAFTMLVDIKSAFAPGLLYVILSRVTNRKFLKIVTPLKVTDVVPIVF